MMNPEDIFDNRIYIESFLQIRDKKGDVVPFELNEPQEQFLKIYEAAEASGPVRMIVLKARQMGLSTLIEALLFKNTALRFNVNSAIITHSSDATANLYRMVELYYDMLPEPLKPMKRRSNRKELLFENPSKDSRVRTIRPGLRSSIKCLTAGAKGVGRSATFTCIHVSEYAFWESQKTMPKDKVLQGILQTVPKEPETIVVIESTANGFDEFKDLWDKSVAGDSEFIPVFIPWFKLSEYRMKYDGFELTAEEEELKKQYGLDNEQIAWRRWCIRANCNNDIDIFRQEYPSNPEEAFLTTGNPVFDNVAIVKRLGEISKRKEIKRGRFAYEKREGVIDVRSIRWEDDSRGEIKIFEEPKDRYPYVIGGDTAGEGSDSFTGIVLNNITANHAATLKRTYDEDRYAEQMFCLGIYYNEALIGVEVNFSTHPVKELHRHDYPNLYRRRDEQGISEKTKDAYGFRTDSVTRPVMLAELVTYVREHTELINDEEVLREMLDFVKVDGRPEARAGKHDDLVMGYAIANHIRKAQSYELLPDDEGAEEYIEDGFDELIEYGI